jgi:hypothetical protein
LNDAVYIVWKWQSCSQLSEYIYPLSLNEENKTSEHQEEDQDSDHSDNESDTLEEQTVSTVTFKCIGATVSPWVLCWHCNF